MTSLDLLGMALKNMWRRKLRTFLTVLGVIIGTASILLMVSLGIGMNESYKRSIMEMGNLTVITVYPGDPMMMEGDMPTSARRGQTAQLDDQALQQFKNIPGVEAATPYLEIYLKLLTRKYVTELPVVGIDPAVMDKMDFNLAQGRLITSEDSLSLVAGSEVVNMFRDRRARNYYGPANTNINLLEEKLELTYDMSYGERRSQQEEADDNKQPVKPYQVRIVGILEQGNWETSNSLFMPLQQVKEIAAAQRKYERTQSERRYYGPSQNEDEYQQIKVKAADINKVQEIQQLIKDMGFQAYSLNDMLEQTKKASAVMQAVLGGIGAVSLLVAALGIANTMIMAIYERIREIGIMKVIGATVKDIKKLFLLEASLIGLSGGILGTGISMLGSWLINRIGAGYVAQMGMTDGTISIIPLWLALSALAFTTFVGLAAGYFPARRAMKLSALEAIRTV